MPGYRQLARNRDFTVLWIGDTVSELGSALSMFAFPLIAYALSGSAFIAAVVEAAYLGGLCAILLPAGVLATLLAMMLTSSRSIRSVPRPSEWVLAPSHPVEPFPRA